VTLAERDTLTRLFQFRHTFRSNMRRFVVLLAACSSGSSTPQTKPPPVPVKPAPRVLEPITGAHGGAINAIALTADGRAAVTGDATGGLRLWPTLDGTREPIVVSAAAADALAIARDGSGFALAVTDAADHVELIRLDNRGHVRSRRPLGTAEQIEFVGDSALALRADQVIDQIAFDGTLRAQLAAEPGTRVDALVVADTHVLAMTSTDKERHARRIDSTSIIGSVSTLAWGEKSRELALGEIGPAVLSADGETLVAMGAENRIMKFDIATGKAKAACPISSMPHNRQFDGFDGVGGSLDAPIGIVNERVACFVDGIFSWFDVDKGTRTTAMVGNAPAPGLMVGVADRVVAVHDHQLVIATPERTDFLGYGFRDLTHVRSVPTGLMIGKGDQEPVLLDDNFREHARFALPKLRVDWTDLVPVDDRFIIASSTRPGSGDLWGSAYQIAVYDTVKQVMHQVLPHRARGGELVYEPSTQLLVATDGNKTMLVRLDRATHSFGNEVVLDFVDVPKQVALLDPKLAGGMIALAIRDEGGGGLVVSELYAADVPPAQEIDGKPAPRTMKPRKTYRIGGELRAVDRAGRLYVHNLMYAESIGIYEHGVSTAQLQGAQAARLRASPDGTQVIAVDNGRLTLFTTAGERVWETAAWGSSDVDWTPTGTLFARFPHALARIELETGALVERQCGWAFGISTTPRDGSSNAPSVCDVAP